MAHLSDSIRVLPGIGPKKQELYAALGIQTLYDLISHFPRTYEDRTRLCTISELQVDEPACFEAMVIQDPRTHLIRRGLEITQSVVADETAKLRLTFFNQKFSASQLRYGESYLFYGTLTGDYRGYGMQNPAFEPVGQSGTATNCILPVYPLTAGLSNKTIRKDVANAISAALPELEELLPESLISAFGLCGIQYAYRTIHMPDSFDALRLAKRRLIFEEFFVFSCGLSLLRAKRSADRREPMKYTDLSGFFGSIPFQLTGAQQRAIGEIVSDFRRSTPMNRLLQGDVGSGKTIVAAAAIICAAQNGLQSAMMVPTEILAEQHLKSLRPFLEKQGYTACLLTGSMSAAAKNEVKRRLADGSCSVVIGTHALFTQDVVYRNLGLVVADEQHRFGVAQRDALVRKGTSPHLLVMSATPIPRTLALILYGDLDISVLDEKPSGRLDVQTFLVGEPMRARINAFIRKQVAEGHQVFIVCPAVEEDETGSLKSVETWAETLQKTVFPDLRIGLLHGQMKDKDAVMRAFSDGEFDVLVATTVIEVGVDVPRATLMVIENAERFGLSQLHQLRGRVGRGDAQSYCVLFSSGSAPETKLRLKAFCSTADGFKIAEEDLSQRGPGDFFGQRQSGLPVFHVADLADDLSVLKEAKDAADRWLQSLTPAEIPDGLRRKIALLFRSGSERLN